MQPETISLSELWRRIPDTDLEKLRLRFKDPERALTRHAAVQFGPMDWVEVAFLDALSGRIQLQNQSGDPVAANRSDLRDFSEEVLALLQNAPSVGSLDGYRIGPQGESLLELLPDSVLTPAKLYRPHIEDPGRDVFIPDDAFYACHMKLPLFWSRRTWQIDFTLCDALRALLTNTAAPMGHAPVDLVDTFLGPITDFERKWRPFVGTTLVTIRSNADGAFAENFRKAIKLPLKAGRKKNAEKSLLQRSVDIFFELFESEGFEMFLRNGKQFNWVQITMHLSECHKISVSTESLRVEAHKDPRLAHLKERIRNK